MTKNLFHPLYRVPYENLHIFHVSHFKLENRPKIVNFGPFWPKKLAKNGQKPFSPALSSPLGKSTYISCVTL